MDILTDFALLWHLLLVLVRWNTGLGLPFVWSGIEILVRIKNVKYSCKNTLKNGYVGDCIVSQA